jgi:hypothetical protein
VKFCSIVGLTIIITLLYVNPVFADYSGTEHRHSIQRYKESRYKDGSYGYEFDDDPLLAEGFGANDTLLKVRPGAVRATLIRPRTSFLNKLFASIEEL